MEEVGLILERGNAGDGESEHLQGGKEDTVEKEEETAEQEEDNTDTEFELVEDEK